MKDDTTRAKALRHHFAHHERLKDQLPSGLATFWEGLLFRAQKVAMIAQVNERHQGREDAAVFYWFLFDGIISDLDSLFKKEPRHGDD